MRQRTILIFCLTHFYPLFIAGHLYWGDWCRRCQVMFTVVPALIICGLLDTWKASKSQLSDSEKFNISYLIYTMMALAGYYTLCIFSLPKWVYDHNIQMAAFIFLTTIFYLLFYKKLKRSEP